MNEIRRHWKPKQKALCLSLWRTRLEEITDVSQKCARDEDDDNDDESYNSAYHFSVSIMVGEHKAYKNKYRNHTLKFS
jgi:hypothetical protein